MWLVAGPAVPVAPDPPAHLLDFRELPALYDARQSPRSPSNGSSLPPGLPAQRRWGAPPRLTVVQSCVTISLHQPHADDMDEVLDTLREWQQDETHVLLHPGDLGWFWRLGGDAAASATRTWRRDGHLVAIGLLDEPFWLRVAIAPDLRQDEPLARRLAADVSDPERGVLPTENVWFDVPRGALLRDLMSSLGWGGDRGLDAPQSRSHRPRRSPGCQDRDGGAGSYGRAHRRAACVLRGLDVH